MKQGVRIMGQEKGKGTKKARGKNWNPPNMRQSR